MLVDMIQEKKNLTEIGGIEGNFSKNILKRGTRSIPKWRIFP